MNQNLNFTSNTISFEISNYLSYDKLLIPIPQFHIVMAELRYATQFLQSYKLYSSSKWYIFQLFLIIY